MTRHVFALLLSVAAAGAAAAGSLEPRKASDLGVLSQTGAPCPLGGYAIADRPGADEDFFVPAKKVLVVTGFEWQVEAGAPGAPVAVLLSAQTNDSQIGLAFAPGTFATDGKSWGSHTTPLVAAGPFRTLCLTVTAGSFVSGTVHGF